MPAVRSRLVAALSVLFLAAGLTACSDSTGAEEPRKPQAALTVSVTTPQSTSLVRTLVATGSIHAWQEAVISPEVGGYRVAAVHVDVGSRVKKGAELVRLSDEILQAEVRSRRAALAQAQAVLVNATAARRRADSLSGSGALSVAELDRLESEQLSSEAGVKAAEAELAASELKLRYTHVLAPDDGVITARTVTVGQIAQPGSEMLRLLRQGRIEWRAEIPEARLAEVRPGQAVQIALVDGSRISGRVRTVAPTVQSGTRTGLVYVDLPEPGSARPGMFARGEIELSSGAASTLPLASVVVRDGYSYVFIVHADQTVERRRVETGALRDGRVEITKGLEPDDQVVERGAGFLQDGDQVAVSAEAAT